MLMIETQLETDSLISSFVGTEIRFRCCLDEKLKFHGAGNCSGGMEWRHGVLLEVRSESHKLFIFLRKYLLQVKLDTFNNPDRQGLE